MCFIINKVGALYAKNKEGRKSLKNQETDVYSWFNLFIIWSFIPVAKHHACLLKKHHFKKLSSFHHKQSWQNQQMKGKHEADTLLGKPQPDPEHGDQQEVGGLKPCPVAAVTQLPSTRAQRRLWLLSSHKGYLGHKWHNHLTEACFLPSRCKAEVHQQRYKIQSPYSFIEHPGGNHFFPGSP